MLVEYLQSAIEELAHAEAIHPSNTQDLRTALDTLAEMGATSRAAECAGVLERLYSTETDVRAKLLETRFLLLPDTDRMHGEWRPLVVARAVSGVQVHDARLAAAMMVRGVPLLLTLNDRDFRRYDGVSAAHPRDVR